jgi:hypothetical protein
MLLLTTVKVVRVWVGNLLTARRTKMPTQAEIEASARVLCRIAFYQLPAAERVCSADTWPDQELTTGGAGLNGSGRRWEAFVHEARLSLEAAELVREKNEA